MWGFGSLCINPDKQNRAHTEAGRVHVWHNRIVGDKPTDGYKSLWKHKWHLPLSRSFSEFGNYHPFVFWIMLERCVVFLSGNGTEASDWSVPLPLFSSESLRTSPGTFWLTALNMPGPITQPTHAATSSAHWGRNNTYSLSQTDTGMTLTARRTFRGEIGGSIKMRHTYKKTAKTHQQILVTKMNVQYILTVIRRNQRQPGGHLIGEERWSLSVKGRYCKLYE